MVSCTQITSQPFAAQGFSRVPICPIPLTPLTAAVRTLNVPNVKSSNRDLAVADLCFVRAASFSARFPRRYVSEQMPSIVRSIAGVFYLGICLRSSDVLGAALPARLDFSIVDTFAYSRVPSEHPYSSVFGSHVFSWRRCANFTVRLPRETFSLCWVASPPVDAVGRLALSVSTSSHINWHHDEGTLIHARTL